MSKRIILVGAAASGKDYLKKKFGNQGFRLDVSYTTRPIREGETEGVDYYFLTEAAFQIKMESSYLKDRGLTNIGFYEWAQHGEYRYGTGTWEWKKYDVFIMEAHGVSKITPEDRKNCFIIYLNPSAKVRKKRLRVTRGWSRQNISHRTKMDNEKFKDFVDFDLEINNAEF